MQRRGDPKEATHTGKDKETLPVPHEDQNQQKKMDTPTETSPKKVIHQTGIDGDSRFKNFSDEFIAFGNMMCAKLNEIVEPIKTSNDQLQKLFEPLHQDMKVVLEERKNNQSIMKVCETVQADQDRIAKKCERIEIENRELKSRLTKLENRMLERNLIFHGIKEDTWDIEDNTKECIWKAISHTVDDKDSRRHLKIARGIRINLTKRLGRYREGHSRPLSVSFE